MQRSCRRLRLCCWPAGFDCDMKPALGCCCALTCCALHGCQRRIHAACTLRLSWPAHARTRNAQRRMCSSPAKRALAALLARAPCRSLCYLYAHMDAARCLAVCLTRNGCAISERCKALPCKHMYTSVCPCRGFMPSSNCSACIRCSTPAAVPASGRWLVCSLQLASMHDGSRSQIECCIIGPAACLCLCFWFDVCMLCRCRCTDSTCKQADRNVWLKKCG